MTYQITKFDYEQQKDDLLRLWEKNLDFPSPERMAWLYGSGTHPVPQTWLLKKGGSLIGAASLLACNFNIFNKDLLGGIAVDLMIDRKFRTIGPALMLIKAIVKECRNIGLQLVIAYQTERTLNVFLKAGYKKLGNLKRYVKILKSEKILGKRVHNKTIKKLVSIPIDFVLYLTSRDKLQHVTHKIFRGYTVINNNRDLFPEIIQVPFRESVEADAAYLRWRYKRLPSKNYNLFKATASGETYGYVAYSTADEIAHIHGIYTSKLNYADVSLGLFISFIRKENIASITLSYFGNSSYERLFRKHGFFPRETGRPIVIHAESMASDPRLFWPASWCLFDGDVDI